MAEQIEQHIRSAWHQAGASYAGIQQTRLAADAAGNNLQLVTDAYSQGVANIIQLIDAQNATLVANQAAANAVYDFLIDLMEAERAIGQLSLLKTPEEREAFFQRLDTHFSNAGTEVRKQVCHFLTYSCPVMSGMDFAIKGFIRKKPVEKREERRYLQGWRQTNHPFKKEVPR